MVTYLDNMGAALPLPFVSEMLPDLALYGNPHSHHPLANRSVEAADYLRRWVLAALGASNEYDCVFTHNCTAAVAMLAACFPFAETSCFAAHQFSHNSVIGIREVMPNRSKFVTFLPPLRLDCVTALLAADGPHLVAFPAECNFSGCRVSQDNVVKTLVMPFAGPNGAFCLMDAAAMVGKAPLHLDASGIHFVAFSFYKVFGFPSGLGALLVRRGDAQNIMRRGKRYFGGGTVENNVFSVAGGHSLRSTFHEAMEDGTTNFQAVAHLAHVLRRPALAKMIWQPDAVQHRHEELRRFCVEGLRRLRHYTHIPAVAVFDGPNDSFHVYSGSSVAFQVRDHAGLPIGHSFVEKILHGHEILLRSGCFCNPGACAFFVGFGDEGVRRAASLGKVCSDAMDFVDDAPTGAVRVSFGTSTTLSDIRTFLTAMDQSFVMREQHHHHTSDQRSPKLPPVSAPVAMRLSRISFFPVKGLPGVDVRRWPLTASGLLYDREWMIFDGRGAAVSPKQFPILSKFSVEVDLDSNILKISCPVPCDSTDLHLRLEDDLSVSHNRHVYASLALAEGGSALVIRGLNTVDAYRTYPHDVDGWLERRLGITCRLARRAGEKSLANTSSLLVVHESSHWQVVREVASSTATPPPQVSLGAYRANLIVTSPSHRGSVQTEAGFIEHSWSRLSLVQSDGATSAILSAEGPCLRCQQVNISAGQLLREPLASIGRLCRRWGLKGVIFGQHFSVLNISDAKAPRCRSRWRLTLMLMAAPTWIGASLFGSRLRPSLFVALRLVAAVSWYWSRQQRVGYQGDREAGTTMLFQGMPVVAS